MALKVLHITCNVYMGGMELLWSSFLCISTNNNITLFEIADNPGIKLSEKTHLLTQADSTDTLICSELLLSLG